MKSVFPIPALVLLALTGLPLAAHAACPTDLEAAAVAAAIVARQPVPVPAGEMSVADGLCGRDKVVRYLAQISGPVVGYKAGLTNLAVQQRFKHDAPLRGTLFQGMLLRDGAELAVDYGIRPVFEADLVVEVADPAALAKADTPLAALKAPVDSFFDDVMVNAEDPALRANRLGLLAVLHAAMNQVADISRLSA